MCAQSGVRVMRKRRGTNATDESIPAAALLEAAALVHLKCGVEICSSPCPVAVAGVKAMLLADMMGKAKCGECNGCAEDSACLHVIVAQWASEGKRGAKWAAEGAKLIGKTFEVRTTLYFSIAIVYILRYQI